MRRVLPLLLLLSACGGPVVAEAACEVRPITKGRAVDRPSVPLANKITFGDVNYLTTHGDGWVNASECGAVADSTTGLDGTDNGAALQAAFNAVPAGGGLVLIPPGKYRIAKRVFTIKNGTTIRGAGQQATRLYFTGMTSSDVAFNFYGASAAANGWIEDLFIDAGGGVGVRFGPWSWFRSGASRVEVGNAAVGFELDNTYGVTLRDCVTSSTTTVRGYWIHGGSTDSTLDNCHTEDGATVAAIHLDNAYGIKIIGGDYEGWGAPGNTSVLLLIDGSGAGNVLVQGAWFEDAPSGGYATYEFLHAIDVRVGGGSIYQNGIVIEGCSFGGEFAGSVINVVGAQGVQIRDNNSAAGSVGTYSVTTSGGALVAYSNNLKSGGAKPWPTAGTQLLGPLAVGWAVVPFNGGAVDFDAGTHATGIVTATSSPLNLNNIWGAIPGGKATLVIANGSGAPLSVVPATGTQIKSAGPFTIDTGAYRALDFVSDGTNWYQVTPADLGASATTAPFSVVYGPVTYYSGDYHENFDVDGNASSAAEMDVKADAVAQYNAMNMTHFYGGSVGRVFWLKMKNATGGALTTLTYPAGVKATWASLADGYTRVLTFLHDGTNWWLASVGPDVPN